VFQVNCSVNYQVEALQVDNSKKDDFRIPDWFKTKDMNFK
jgi:hypothetical protein